MFVREFFDKIKKIDIFTYINFRVDRDRSGTITSVELQQALSNGIYCTIYWLIIFLLTIAS